MQARLRVIASDGVRTMTADSPVYALADQAPVVTIERPTDGQEFDGVQSVALEAMALDAEDGRLDGSSVVWTSNLDGHIATGARSTVRADHLTEGTHVLTVSATDSAGLVGSSTATIHIARIAAPPQQELVFTFGGFERPVSGQDVNEARAGRTLPIKWTVGREDPDVSAVASASFDADGATYAMRRADGTYHLNVATPGSWAGTVRTFTVEFTDGQRFSAPFAFR
jgi:hypothetical protein